MHPTGRAQRGRSSSGNAIRSRITLIVACTNAAGCAGQADLPSPPTIGEPVPAYEAVTLAGDSVSLDAERGDVVLLNVWATWCHPCRDEIPVLQALHEAHADEGLEIIGVSVDAAGNRDEIERFLDEFGVTYDIWRDPAERISAMFYTVGVPATFLIARDGTLLWRHVGPVRAGDAELERLLSNALARTASTSQHG
ncbi:MAG: TlpA family protein disulfide reductase [Gemmatimonadaceae bacterium]